MPEGGSVCRHYVTAEHTAKMMVLPDLKGVRKTGKHYYKRAFVRTSVHGVLDEEGIMEEREKPAGRWNGPLQVKGNGRCKNCGEREGAGMVCRQI
jgi:hypothetical protein